jgi:PPM family protein phosphatase
MHFDYYKQTDAGLIRHNNEDSVAVDPRHRVVVLADGMGGYNAGEVASDIATRQVLDELARWLSEEGPDTSAREIKRAMEQGVDSANRAIFEAAQSNPLYAGMGTTLVMGVFQDGRAMIGHVGDSRCYRLRGHTLQQITRDHSLLQEQIDAGLISLAQARVATHKNLVTRALGVEDTVSLEVNEYRVEEGDLYLFCSDGLCDMVSDKHIASIVMGDAPLDHKGRALIQAAVDGGGRDNVSVILVSVGTPPGRPGLFSRILG